MLIVAFILLISLTVSAWVWLSPETKAEPIITSPTRAANITASPQDNAARERIEAEIITIRPTGFEPGEIKRPKGRFLLSVDNRSGLEEVSLRLDQERGNRQREARVQRDKLDWRELVDLPPGRYTLTEANHPDWACFIIISEN